jgi:hypothetical protein
MAELVHRCRFERLRIIDVVGEKDPDCDDQRFVAEVHNGSDLSQRVGEDSDNCRQHLIR